MTPETATSRPPTSRVCQGPRRMPSRAATSDGTVSPGAGVVRFTHALVQMDGPGIELQAAGLKSRRASADDDVAWWEATLTLDRALRQGGLRREAAMAAHSAAQAVLAAAARAGLAPTPEVTAVARSAAETARVLAAGRVMNAPLADYLTRDWKHLLVPRAELPSAPRPPGGRRHRSRVAPEKATVSSATNQDRRPAPQR